MSNLEAQSERLPTSTSNVRDASFSPEVRRLLSQLRSEAEQDVRRNVLPFWAEHAFDPISGGLVGRVTNDLRRFDTDSRHSVLCSRILWTFSSAHSLFPVDGWNSAARKALSLLENAFSDPRYGGVYWSLYPNRSIQSARKQVYAQAFAIYGLAEWYAATGDLAALTHAKELFHLLERFARDGRNGGYVEALTREWGPLEDMRLSAKDLNAPKSMNTLLHVMEAYTRLLQVWPNEELKSALRSLVTVILERVYTHNPFPRLALFFDLEWNSLNNVISFGHDIEASWLLCEAAHALGDTELTAKVHAVAILIGESVLAHGVDQDGSIFYEGTSSGISNDEKHWWVHAEAAIGFLNCWSLTGRTEFLQASLGVWMYITRHFVDRKHGEWFAVLERNGTPKPDYPEFSDSCKIGPWKCPYHNARASMEILRRLSR
jgi:cellobiose epimerase